MPFLDLLSPELHYCGRIKDNKYDDYNVNNSIRIRVLMQTNWLRLKMMHQYFVGSNLIWDVQWLRGHEWVVKHASFCPCSGLKMLTKGTFMWFWSVSLADQLSSNFWVSQKKFVLSQRPDIFFCPLSWIFCPVFFENWSLSNI